MRARRLPVSVIIHTKNEERGIAACINSVRESVAQIIVVDMESTDTTVSIASKLGAKILHIKDHAQGVDAVRTQALQAATQPWTLVLDADESISPTLMEYLRTILKDPDADGYLIPRKNIIWNDWINNGGWWPDYQLRLFRTGSVEWRGGVHLQPVCSGVVTELPAQESLAILHENYTSVSQFLRKLDRYTSIEASERDPDKQEESLPMHWSREFGRRFFGLDLISCNERGVALGILQGMYELIVSLKHLERTNQLSSTYSTDSVLTDLTQARAELAFWHAHYRQHHAPLLSKPLWWLRKKLKV